MIELQRFVAAHPLAGLDPYGRVKFSRVNQHKKPVYKVGKGKTEYGAERALRIAFERFGGNCFHCGNPIASKDEFTLDHLRPKADDGGEHLHNLVFACRKCNWSKGSRDLATFKAKIATGYLKALDEHLVRCLDRLATAGS